MAAKYQKRHYEDVARIIRDTEKIYGPSTTLEYMRSRFSVLFEDDAPQTFSHLEFREASLS